MECRGQDGGGVGCTAMTLHLWYMPHRAPAVGGPPPSLSGREHPPYRVHAQAGIPLSATAYTQRPYLPAVGGPAAGMQLRAIHVTGITAALCMSMWHIGTALAWHAVFPLARATAQVQLAVATHLYIILLECTGRLGSAGPVCGLRDLCHVGPPFPPSKCSTLCAYYTSCTLLQYYTLLRKDVTTTTHMCLAAPHVPTRFLPAGRRPRWPRRHRGNPRHGRHNLLECRRRTFQARPRVPAGHNHQRRGT